MKSFEQVIEGLTCDKHWCDNCPYKNNIPKKSRGLRYFISRIQKRVKKNLHGINADDVCDYWEEDENDEEH